MRLLRTAVLTGLLATCVPGIQASSAVRPAAVPVAALRVTGQVKSLASYAASGLTPRQVAVLAPLDRLAASGLDARLLTAASAGTLGGAPSEQSVFLSGLGDLNGHGADVVEQHLTQAGDSATLELFVRDGGSGALLWKHATTTKDGFAFARPGVVGTRGRQGLLVQTFGFTRDGVATTLDAFDARGVRAWRRTVTAPFSSAGSDSSLGASSSSDYIAQYVATDLALRSGAREDVAVTESYSSSSSNGVQSSHSGSLQLQAISTATGALRQLPGSVSSSDGAVTGDVVDDLNGDRYADLLTVDGGSAHTATARTAAGTVLWQRTDVPTYGAGFLTPVGHLTGARAPDLAFVTSANPGAAASTGAPQLPVGDPTASAHGQVLLLRGATGETVWSRAGDDAYPLLRAGRPAVGVLSVTVTRGTSSSSVSATLVAVDAAGGDRWSRTLTASADDDPNAPFPTYVGALAVPLVDTDADGGLEGLFVAYAFGQQDMYNQHLVRSRDGADLRDQTSGLLGEGLTRRGTDRSVVTAGAAGLTVTVRSGLSGRLLVRAVVPGSRGVRAGEVSALRRSAAPCADLLVNGGGGSRTVVAVLASNGAPRWSLGRLTKARGAGTVVRARTAPAPRC